MRRRRQAARPLQRVGPWAREDYRSFKRLCTDALRLELPSGPLPPPPVSEDLRPSSYPNFAAAQRDLRKHIVYGWFKSCIPRAVSAKDKTPFTQFRRLRALVEYIPHILLGPAEPIRRTRQRDAAVAAIRRVQKSIGGGVLYFPDANQEAMLEELLTEAIEILERPLQRLDKSVKYPSVKWLADELRERTGTVDALLLFDVAIACGLEDFTERTAQQYAKTARRLLTL